MILCTVHSLHAVFLLFLDKIICANAPGIHYELWLRVWAMCATSIYSGLILCFAARRVSVSQMCNDRMAAATLKCLYIILVYSQKREKKNENQLKWCVCMWDKEVMYIPECMRFISYIQTIDEYSHSLISSEEARRSGRLFIRIILLNMNSNKKSISVHN